MVENMLKRLRPANKMELLVGIGFSLLGFSIGSLLIGKTLNSKIQLDSPNEVDKPASKPYWSELSPDGKAPNVTNPHEEDSKQLLKKDQPSAAPSLDNKFTSLSQEQKNCVIWKNAYPEVAYKLKQGDACY